MSLMTMSHFLPNKQESKTLKTKEVMEKKEEEPMSSPTNFYFQLHIYQINLFLRTDSKGRCCQKRTCSCPALSSLCLPVYDLGGGIGSVH